MFAAYVTVTVLASVLNGLAAVTYLVGHDYPKRQADMKRVPRSWVPVLGMLLAAGSVGLLAGFAVPLLGDARRRRPGAVFSRRARCTPARGFPQAHGLGGVLRRRGRRVSR